MKCLFVSAVGLAAVLASALPASAKTEPYRLESLDRFSRAPADHEDATQNVEVKKEDYKNLPLFIRSYVDMIAACGQGQVSVDDIGVWSYVSDWNRKRELPANYLVSTEGLAGRYDSGRCVLGRACVESACGLLAYNAQGNEQWLQTLALVGVKSWELEWPQAAPKAAANRPTLKITQFCSPKEPKGYCARTLTWAAHGFTNNADSGLLPPDGAQMLEAEEAAGDAAGQAPTR